MGLGNELVQAICLKRKRRLNVKGSEGIGLCI